MTPPGTPAQQPIGLILAGGEGVRIGGAKAAVALNGRALVQYPLAAMRAAVADVRVISKAQTLLPQLERATIWIEPDLPRHPLLGVVEALALAEGRPVLSCPLDLPFVTSALLSSLASTPTLGRSAVVATSAGVARPLLGCYRPDAAPLLLQAVRRGAAPEQVLELLSPVLVEVEDQTELFDVDTPDDLLQAAAMLDRLQRRARA